MEAKPPSRLQHPRHVDQGPNFEKDDEKPIPLGLCIKFQFSEGSKLLNAAFGALISVMPVEVSAVPESSNVDSAIPKLL